MEDSANTIKLYKLPFFLLNAFRYSRDNITVIISIMMESRRVRIEMMM